MVQGNHGLLINDEFSTDVYSKWLQFVCPDDDSMTIYAIIVLYTYENVRSYNTTTIS